MFAHGPVYRGTLLSMRLEWNMIQTKAAQNCPWNTAMMSDASKNASWTLWQNDTSRFTTSHFPPRSFLLPQPLWHRRLQPGLNGDSEMKIMLPAFWDSSFHHSSEKRKKGKKKTQARPVARFSYSWAEMARSSKCLGTPKSQMNSNWRMFTLRGSFCTGRWESAMDSLRKSVPNWTSHKRHHRKPIFCSANFMTGPDAGFCERHTKSFRRFFCNAKCA